MLGGRVREVEEVFYFSDSQMVPAEACSGRQNQSGLVPDVPRRTRAQMFRFQSKSLLDELGLS